jgi:hypothetical protein
MLIPSLLFPSNAKQQRRAMPMNHMSTNAYCRPADGGSAVPGGGSPAASWSGGGGRVSDFGRQLLFRQPRLPAVQPPHIDRCGSSRACFTWPGSYCKGPANCHALQPGAWGRHLCWLASATLMLCRCVALQEEPSVQAYPWLLAQQ